MQVATHVDYLDGWRGVAITLLLVGHFFAIPGINLGTLGVNFFFVLSGLLMAQLLFVKEVPLNLFYRRRIARIFPAVMVFLLLIVLGYVLAGRTIDWLDVAAAGFFVNNYVEGTTGPWRMPLGHIWSLSVEEHSYIVLSLIAVAARRKLAKARTLVLLAAACIAGFNVLYAVRYEGAALSKMNLHTEVAAFGIFASAAILLSMRKKTVPKLPAAVFIGLVGFAIATHWWSIPGPVRTIAGVGALALAANLMAGAPAWIHAALSLAPLRQLGLWSFSLYVWQQPFYMYYRYYGMNRYLGFALAIACGVASYYLIEKPAREWLNAHWGRQPAMPGATPPAHA